MNQEFKKSSGSPASLPISGPISPEDTLRLLATVEPPIGLADRVHRRLANARKKPAPRGIWQSLMPIRRLQYAGAAVLVLAIAGSMWEAYRPHNVPARTILQGTSTGIQGASSVGPQNSGGFKSAGTERRPATLTPIHVPASKTTPVQKKKPSASRLKPSVKPTPQTSNTSSPLP